MKLAFLIGYDGRNFAGSQFQPDKRTVEGEFIETGISMKLWDSPKAAEFRTAGRTDKGVSARKQLITVRTDKPDLAKEALNFHLPDDIWCVGFAEVDDAFSARYSATQRTYRYYFPYPLDSSKMNEAAKLFEGTHDFSGFSKMEKGRDPIRTVISSRVFDSPSGTVFEISAKSFLWNMVRGMAGILQCVGLGLCGCEEIAKQLANPEYRIHPAPAEGLLFYDISCGLEFKPMRQKDEVKRNFSRSASAARLETFVSEALLEDDAVKFWKEDCERKYSTIIK
ncbi:MAG: tRNA pseudouridine(38-40) synthase TruA [Methanocorpusculum sp.]|nr:tRNA pseudouridine(38-40) synthase TruA [Methanocorpusculum sp.]